MPTNFGLLMTSHEKNDRTKEARIGPAVKTATRITDRAIMPNPNLASRRRSRDWVSTLCGGIAVTTGCAWETLISGRLRGGLEVALQTVEGTLGVARGDGLGGARVQRGRQCVVVRRRGDRAGVRVLGERVVEDLPVLRTGARVALGGRQGLVGRGGDVAGSDDVERLRLGEDLEDLPGQVLLLRGLEDGVPAGSEQVPLGLPLREELDVERVRRHAGVVQATGPEPATAGGADPLRGEQALEGAAAAHVGGRSDAGLLQVDDVLHRLHDCRGVGRRSAPLVATAATRGGCVPGIRRAPQPVATGELALGEQVAAVGVHERGPAAPEADDPVEAVDARDLGDLLDRVV